MPIRVIAYPRDAAADHWQRLMLRVIYHWRWSPKNKVAGVHVVTCLD